MSSDPTLRQARLGIAALALLYCAAHLAWFARTPLGAFPVLDGRELLELARLMANGGLPAEPFYRAPLYSALISVCVRLGAPDALLPDIARLINLVAHTTSALLVFELARRMWGRLGAGVLAGALYALYPVAIDFASDPLDITLATTLALAATLCAWIAAERPSLRWAAAAAALMALAALARPNFLVCLPALWLWQGVLCWRQRGQTRLLVASVLGAGVLLGAMGFINLAVGDEFRVLPWQGGHALWDSNGPQANGLFYSHSIDIPDLVPGTNPARAEAQILYCRDRPCSERLDIDDFQAYWRGRTFAYIRAQPAAWTMLIASKLYYLINNYEQYNNKTYWVHKERSPWLHWNPLCWALIFAAALGALLLPLAPRARWLLLLLIGAYAASLLLYLVSARFRVPLVGWLCVASGGWVSLRAHAPGLSRRAGVAIGVALLGGAFAAIPVPNHLRQGTVTEDWMLMSSAALAAGDWQQSEDWAARVLERTPDRHTAHAMLCSARLLAWEQSPDDALPPQPWLQDSLLHCAAGAKGSDRSDYNAAFFLSALCRQQDAAAVFMHLSDSALVGELARNALAALGRAPIRAADATVGLLKLQQSALEDRKPGQRSMLAAILGKHCARASEPTLPEAAR